MDVFESYPRSLLLSLGSSVMAVYKRSSRRMKNRSFLKEEGARRRHAFDGKEWTNEFAEETFSIRDGQFEKDTHYRIEKTVGRGSFGVTYKATNISGSFTFCLKMCGYVKEEILALDLARKEEAKEIVKYYGAKLVGRNAIICMEYMEGGTLQQHIERQRENLQVIAEETCFVFVRDILKGLAFLNSKGLVHGDINGDNVLLDESCTHVKLADFGLSRKIEVSKCVHTGDGVACEA
ncbi:Cell division control protein 15, partial [Acropora cervicornis]